MSVSCATTGSMLAGAGTPSAPPERTRSLGASETGHRHCILLIDDHFEVRAALKAALTILDCHVMDTGTGAEALKCLHGGLRPCLIFLDPGMPRGSAWLFRTFQLADPQLATIPVAVLSGRDLCPATADSLHVSHWLVKPPDIEEMVRLAASYCGADTHHRESEKPDADVVARPAR
jgi:CheY-like chemotaxis protein